MLFGGKLQDDVDDLFDATAKLEKEVEELREMVRRQQYRIAELEDALTQSAAPPAGGPAQPRAATAEDGRLRGVDAVLGDVRRSLELVQHRLDEHEKGMIWLYGQIRPAAAKEATAESREAK
jgi:hypothetical protein